MQGMSRTSCILAGFGGGALIDSDVTLRIMRAHSAGGRGRY